MAPYYAPVKNSTNVQGLAYDSKTGRGFVEFIGGRRYAYEMTPDLFKRLQEAKSVGTFFAREVKGQAKQVWKGQRCDNSPCNNDAELRALGSAGFCVCRACQSNSRFSAITFEPIPNQQNTEGKSSAAAPEEK